MQARAHQELIISGREDKDKPTSYTISLMGNDMHRYFVSPNNPVLHSVQITGAPAAGQDDHMENALIYGAPVVFPLPQPLR